MQVRVNIHTLLTLLLMRFDMRIGKHEIRYDNVAYWPCSIKIAICFLIIALLLPILYILILKPQLDKLLQARSQTTYLEDSFAETVKLTKQFPEYQLQTKILQTQSAPLKEKLYDKGRENLIDFLSKSLKSSNLKLLLLQPEKPKIKVFYLVIPLTIKTSGKFQEIITLIAKLIHKKIMFNFEKFSLYKQDIYSKKSNLIFDFDIDIYLNKSEPKWITVKLLFCW